MKVNYAPLVSGVSGRFGGQVFSSWRGINLVRSFTPPAQPRTVAQLAVRNAFRAGNALFEAGTAEFVEAWNARRGSSPGTARNIFVGSLIRETQGQTELANFEFLQGQVTYPAPASIAGTPGTSEIAVALTAPTPPAGFTISNYILFAQKNVDPHESFDLTDYDAQFVTQAGLTVTFSGLENTQEYVIGGAVEYTRTADSMKFYSSSVQGTATPTT